MNEWQQEMNEFTHPLFVSFSFSSLILNLLVILVIREAMKARRTHAQLQLLCLSFSDISVGVAYVWDFVLSSVCDISKPCEEAKPCLYLMFGGIHFIQQTLLLNRSMTICITYVRCKVVSGFRGAQETNEKTPRRMLAELIIYSLLLHFLSSLVILGLIYLFRSFDLAVFVVGVSIAVLMAVMTGFIFYRLRLNYQRSQHRTRRVAVGDFQKLAALVALVFCCCQLIVGVLTGIEWYDPLWT